MGRAWNRARGILIYKFILKSFIRKDVLVVFRAKIWIHIWSLVREACNRNSELGNYFGIEIGNLSRDDRLQDFLHTHTDVSRPSAHTRTLQDLLHTHGCCRTFCTHTDVAGRSAHTRTLPDLLHTHGRCRTFCTHTDGAGPSAHTRTFLPRAYFASTLCYFLWQSDIVLYKTLVLINYFIPTNALHYFSVFLSLHMFRHSLCHPQGCRREFTVLKCIQFTFTT
jgi:hypothetical protein